MGAQLFDLYVTGTICAVELEHTNCMYGMFEQEQVDCLIITQV